MKRASKEAARQHQQAVQGSKKAKQRQRRRGKEENAVAGEGGVTTNRTSKKKMRKPTASRANATEPEDLQKKKEAGFELEELPGMVDPVDTAWRFAFENSPHPCAIAARQGLDGIFCERLYTEQYLWCVVGSSPS